jgi:hypothetical protein
MRRLLSGLIVFFFACGGPWQKQSLPAPANQFFSSLSALWVFSDSDVWVGGDRALHFDGSKWTDVGLPNGNIPISDLWGLAPNDLWATGGAKIFRWQGSAWTEVPVTITNVPDLDTLWVKSADDFAVGGGAVNTEVLRFFNGSWSRRYTSVKDLWGAASDDVWVAAEGDGFWHWTGATWNQVTVSSGNGDRPISVFGSAANDVWAAGESTTLQHWNGTAWAATETSAETDWSAVWAAASNDVWIAGEDMLGHYDGSKWTTQSVGALGVRLTKLSGSSSKSVWALGYELSTSGNHGVVYRYRP